MMQCTMLAPFPGTGWSVERQASAIFTLMSPGGSHRASSTSITGPSKGKAAAPVRSASPSGCSTPAHDRKPDAQIQTLR